MNARNFYQIGYQHEFFQGCIYFPDYSNHFIVYPSAFESISEYKYIHTYVTFIYIY